MTTVISTSRKEKIKAKITALLNKTTENGATEDEMTSAMRKAKQLMVLYFISEKDLEESKEKIVTVSTPIVRTGFQYRAILPTLCELYDCEHYQDKKLVYFVGYESDAEICVYFYQKIFIACMNALKEYQQTSDFKRLKRLWHSRTLSASFVHGFQEGIDRKVQAILDDVKRDCSTETGLVLRSKKIAVTDHLNSLGLNIHISAINRRAESPSFSDGIQKGEEYNLHDDLHAGKTINQQLNQ